MKNVRAERAALDALKSARGTALARMTALMESQSANSGLVAELDVLTQAIAPKGKTRYFALFNAVSNTIQCLEIIRLSRRKDTELCQEIGVVIDELTAAQLNAEEKYIASEDAGCLKDV